MEPTQFAPAERDDQQDVQIQTQMIQDVLLHNELLDTVPQILTILNDKRQVVYANQKLYDLLGSSDSRIVFGRRPGEILDCVHAHESEGGCGTTEFCRECGAVNTILEAQAGEYATKECRILTRGNTAFDLRVWAKPYDINGETYTIFTVLDIADEKRREALERTFFHDVMNTAGNIMGASSLLMDEDRDIKTEMAEIIKRSSNQLVEEIRSHRILVQAEKGELAVQHQELQSRAVLENIITSYTGSHLARDRSIELDPSIEELTFKSDPAILSRVLGNLLKNALEATVPGGTVTLTCRQADGDVVFEVHNPTHMPREVQLQVFQRSFSTKGAGRGIGTYSIKLFTEKYLNGKVWFDTDPEDGTRFSVVLKM